MTADKIKKMLLESTIDKALKEMAVDSRRAVRKLVDLGSRFGGNGFSAQIMQKAEPLLANERSPYYQLIQDLAANTDHAKLKTFGLNIGYNAWGNGIKLLRQRQSELKMFLPWYLVLQIADNQNINEADHLIKEGNKLGIYLYCLDLRKTTAFSFAVTSLMRSHADCAFVAVVPAQQIIPQNMGGLMACRNLLLLVDSQSSDFLAAASLLRQHHCFFGAFCTYGDTTVGGLARGEWLEPILNAKVPLAFLLAEPSTSETKIEQCARYVNNEREAPRYPLLLIDFIADGKLINKYIYGKECTCTNVIDIDALSPEPLLSLIKQEKSS